MKCILVTGQTATGRKTQKNTVRKLNNPVARKQTSERPKLTAIPSSYARVRKAKKSWEVVAEKRILKIKVTPIITGATGKSEYDLYVD